MKLLSPAFKNGETIPQKYGYKHGNFSPPLIIEDVPKDSLSLVLIMDDPDAMKAVGKIWLHWILWNIPVDTKIINENSIPENSIQGMNDFGEIGYGGPAPPDQIHTYFFKLYAINKKLDLKANISKSKIESLIKSSIISQVSLEGKFAPQ